MAVADTGIQQRDVNYTINVFRNNAANIRHVTFMSTTCSIKKGTIFCMTAKKEETASLQKMCSKNKRTKQSENR